MLDSSLHQLKQTASDVWIFLKNPKDKNAAEQSATSKRRVLLQVLSIYIVLSIVFSVLLEGLSQLGWYNSDNHAVAEMVKKYPVWAVLLLGIVVVPLLEEFIFRYGLSFRKGYISAVFTVALFATGIYSFYLLPLYGALAVTVLLGITLVVYFINAETISNYLEKIWPGVYAPVFYAVAFLFGLIHITNYTNFDYTSLAVLLIPVLVAPQIIGGLLMGYMRVKHGFYWGYFLHAGHNAVFMILGFAFMNPIEEKLSVANENYSLKVEEHMLYDQKEDKISYLGADSIAFVNENLNDVIYALLQEENMFLEFDRSRYQHTTVDLHFKNNAATQEIGQSKKLLLSELQKLYKFDVTYKNKVVKAWDLKVENRDLLTAHAVEDTGTSTVNRHQEGITLKNVTIDQLLNTIHTDFKVYLHSERTPVTVETFNFQLPKNNFGKVKDELKSKYGLLLHAKLENTKQVLVEFQN